MKYPLKLIEWTDACNGNHNWFDPETMPTECRLFLVQTIGFEVQRTDDRVVLAMSISDRGSLCDLFTIPRAVIVREQTFRSRLTQEKKDD